MSSVLSILCLLLFLGSCTRTPLKNIADAMKPVKSVPTLKDTLPSESFFSGLKAHIEVMKTSPQVTNPMVFGPVKIEKDFYISSLEEILRHQNDFISWINNNFDFYEVYGGDRWGEVLTTGYYEPHVMGSHEKSSEFSQALYALPSDIIIPYFDRKEIDVNNKLAGRNLELVWVDPIDAFFIQIQGSGLVETYDGEKIRVGYAGKNGRPYEAIGKFLTDVIPMEEMSMQKIKAYLKILSPDRRQEILNKNPSYVFFKKLTGESLTSAGMEVNDGRTIATDNNFFPKGALAFLNIADPISLEKSPRLVFDQDTGGAIRGGGHIDLYFGKDEIAFQKAGIMKQKGQLYYLVPKDASRKALSKSAKN